MPYMKRNNDLLSALKKMKKRPNLIADAGTMMSPR